MTDPAALFQQAFAACPLVAVLRGLTPDEAPAVADALVDAGFTLIEVPLNSPEPLESIRLLSTRYRAGVVIGAGTVLTPADVTRVAEAGGRLIVSPNTDIDVIRASVAAGCISLPGYFTPSEGFAALAAGAHGLKLFPAEGASPAFLKAQRAVLPRSAAVLAVGGITPETMPAWRAAGADGFGLGSNLYKAGKPVADIAADAQRFVSATRDLA
ncbi:2-dehydro-3-deoxy-6-phosphogalactonate aldolase [Sphingomonas aracearum]|uniref:2-dehydro-3-deoxy-6-phosphogalactonate aldolase n=1 Tax=Sphingomonas aracearum TaxID=2283317 RepID=A0A369W004_9SPHN|nr:2-dehydro-3-deoxy-6-phosphogalactonate aldolase [Sphingomonas aracearum]RDE07237.1 2-dehydro-3-deoxy-6-phosphogalactonate aldolase [Sphingomonas aracearum]